MKNAKWTDWASLVGMVIVFGVFMWALGTGATGVNGCTGAWWNC